MKSTIKSFIYTIITIVFFVISVCVVDCLYLNNFLLGKIVERSISSKSVKITIQNLKFNYFTRQISIGNISIKAKDRAVVSATIEKASIKFRSLLHLDIFINVPKCILLSSEFISYKQQGIILSNYKIYVKNTGDKYHINVNNSLDNTLDFIITNKSISVQANNFFLTNNIVFTTKFLSQYNNSSGKIEQIISSGHAEIKNGDIIIKLPSYLISHNKLYSDKNNLATSISKSIWDIDYGKKGNNKVNVRCKIDSISLNQYQFFSDSEKELCIVDNEKNSLNCLLNIITPINKNQINQKHCINVDIDLNSKDIDINLDISKVILSNIKKYLMHVEQKHLHNLVQHVQNNYRAKGSTIKMYYKNVTGETDIKICLTNYLANLLPQQYNLSQEKDLVLNVELKKNYATKIFIQQGDRVMCELDSKFVFRKKKISITTDVLFFIPKEMHISNYGVVRGVVRGKVQTDILKDVVTVNTKGNLTDCFFNLIFANIYKKDNFSLAFSTTTTIQNDTFVTDVKIQGDKNFDMAFNIETSKDKICVVSDKVQYQDSCLNYSIDFFHQQQLLKLCVTGDKLDFSDLDIIQWAKSIILPKCEIYMLLDIKVLKMNNDQQVSNFYITSHTKVDSIEQVFCNAKINEDVLLEINSKKDFDTKSNFLGKTSIAIFTNDVGSILKSIGIPDVLSAGEAHIEVSTPSPINTDIKSDLLKELIGSIKIKNFYLHNPPKILQMLVINILSPIFLGQDKALFYNLKSKFIIKDNQFFISDLFASGLQFSFSVSKGCVTDKSTKCRGYIIPSIILPMVFPVPVPYVLNKTHEN